MIEDEQRPAWRHRASQPMLASEGRRRMLALAAIALLLSLAAASGCSSFAPTDGSASLKIPDAATTLEAAASAPAELPAVATVEPAASAPSVVAAADDAASSPGAHIDSVPLSPRYRLDSEHDAQSVDLWQRVRTGFVLPELQGEMVHRWEQWYASRPDYVERMTARGSRYLFHIVEELERREMPTELALLPFVESAFNPQAVSRAAAAGMWQFMPGTGRDFELRQNLFRDDRRDVLASTRAALDYLQRLHAQFGDWQLALAAYNCGPGNVKKALERNRRAGLPTDYASLRLPNETREYVPKLQAVKNIVLRPGDYALSLAPLDNHPFFLQVAIDRDIDVALAARLSGMSLDEFQQLNPQLNKPVILAAGTPQVLLPYDSANRFVRSLGEHRGPLATWTAWVAPRTVKPAEAARLVGMPEAQLREVNVIPPNMLVRVGSTLLVPRGPQLTDDVAGPIADHGMISLAPEKLPPRRVVFPAGRRGDSVLAVARRYRVRAEDVASWNGVALQAHFSPGQAIIILLPARAVRSRAKAVPGVGHAAPATRAGAVPARKPATSNKAATHPKSGGATRKPGRHAADPARPVPAR